MNHTKTGRQCVARVTALLIVVNTVVLPVGTADAPATRTPCVVIMSK